VNLFFNIVIFSPSLGNPREGFFLREISRRSSIRIFDLRNFAQRSIQLPAGTASATNESKKSDSGGHAESNRNRPIRDNYAPQPPRPLRLKPVIQGGPIARWLALTVECIEASILPPMISSQTEGFVGPIGWTGVAAIPAVPIHPLSPCSGRRAAGCSARYDGRRLKRPVPSRHLYHSGHGSDDDPLMRVDPLDALTAAPASHPQGDCCHAQYERCRCEPGVESCLHACLLGNYTRCP